MMKKNGFTLAEVLITLSIIGVVATMTLPALMTNTQEQQAKTGLKKAINTLTEAAQMNQAIEGWDYGSAFGTNVTMEADADFTTQSFTSILGNRTNIDYKQGDALPNGLTLSGADSAVYFKDGTALYYSSTDTKAVRPTEGEGATTGNTARQEDGLSLGYVVYYDTNGKSGPNVLSHCGTEDNITEYDNFVSPAEATTACKTKADREIKDIFKIRLRDNVAQPEGAAATWSFHGNVESSTEDPS